MRKRKKEEGQKAETIGRKENKKERKGKNENKERKK